MDVSFQEIDGLIGIVCEGSCRSRIRGSDGAGRFVAKISLKECLRFGVDKNGYQFFDGPALYPVDLARRGIPYREVKRG